MAHQAAKGIPLAHGMRLNHGQIIGSAPTMATKSTKAKTGVSQSVTLCDEIETIGE
jgi:hypothetical protein